MPHVESETAGHRTTDGPRHAGPRAPHVVLVGGDDASGMACMLAELLHDNVRDFPGRARCARLARGAVVLTASDRDRSVTLSFGPGTIRVSDGSASSAPTIAGPWLEMTKLCSGTLSPARALKERKLSVKRPWRPDLLGIVGYVLSVPPSFYGEKRAVEAWQVAAVAAGVIAVGGAAVTISRRRARSLAVHADRAG